MFLLSDSGAYPPGDHCCCCDRVGGRVARRHAKRLPLGLRASSSLQRLPRWLRGGEQTRADYARRGDREPTGQDLDALALREADRLHVRRDRGQWIEGFRNGFTRGFEEFSNQASNQRASWSRLLARPDFPLKLA